MGLVNRVDIVIAIQPGKVVSSSNEGSNSRMMRCASAGLSFGEGGLKKTPPVETPSVSVARRELGSRRTGAARKKRRNSKSK